MSPRFTQNGNRYKTYWWFFARTIAIAIAVSATVAGIYTLAVIAQVLLGYIGLGVAVLMFLALIALGAWISQK